MAARKENKLQTGGESLKKQAAKKPRVSNLSPRAGDSDKVRGGMNKHYTGNHNETFVRIF